MLTCQKKNKKNKKRLEIWKELSQVLSNGKEIYLPIPIKLMNLYLQ